MSERLRFVKLACLGAVAAGLAAWPAAAICVVGGEFRVSEVEVLSCLPAGPRLEEDLAKENAELKVKTESVEPSAAELRQYLEHREVQLRKEVTSVVLLEVRPIRDRVFPTDPRQDPSAKGVWKKKRKKDREARQILVDQSKPADCTGLSGKRIHVISDMPCCDVIPGYEVACVINLWQGSIAPPELVGDLD